MMSESQVPYLDLTLRILHVLLQQKLHGMRVVWLSDFVIAERRALWKRRCTSFTLLYTQVFQRAIYRNVISAEL